jgi:hypothetical protein
MSLDSPLAECEASGGARLTLYANRLVQQSADSMETVPLAQLAAVRVAFVRDAGKCYWAAALLVAALVLALVSGPLQRWLAAAAARFGEPARAESLDALLHGVLNVLGAFARLLPTLAGLLALVAILLLVFFWLGRTELSLMFGAAERSYSAYGRNRFLADFAHTVAEQLAARKH